MSRSLLPIGFPAASSFCADSAVFGVGWYDICYSRRSCEPLRDERNTSDVIPSRLRRFLRVILPDGQITSCFPKWFVQPLLQKYFCFGPRQISSLIRTVSSHLRGVSRSSRTRGGMRWTRGRQAMSGDGRAGRKARELTNGTRTTDVFRGR